MCTKCDFLLGQWSLLSFIFTWNACSSLHQFIFFWSILTQLAFDRRTQCSIHEEYLWCVGKNKGQKCWILFCALLSHFLSWRYQAHPHPSVFSLPFHSFINNVWPEQNTVWLIQHNTQDRAVDTTPQPRWQEFPMARKLPLQCLHWWRSGDAVQAGAVWRSYFLYRWKNADVCFPKPIATSQHLVRQPDTCNWYERSKPTARNWQGCPKTRSSCIYHSIKTTKHSW